MSAIDQRAVRRGIEGRERSAAREARQGKARGEPQKARIQAAVVKGGILCPPSGRDSRFSMIEISAGSAEGSPSAPRKKAMRRKAMGEREGESERELSGSDFDKEKER